VWRPTVDTDRRPDTSTGTSWDAEHCVSLGVTLHRDARRSPPRSESCQQVSTADRPSVDSPSWRCHGNCHSNQRSSSACNHSSIRKRSQRSTRSLSISDHVIVCSTLCFQRNVYSRPTTDRCFRWDNIRHDTILNNAGLHSSRPTEQHLAFLIQQNSKTEEQWQKRTETRTNIPPWPGTTISLIRFKEYCNNNIVRNDCIISYLWFVIMVRISLYKESAVICLMSIVKPIPSRGLASYRQHRCIHTV